MKAIEGIRDIRNKVLEARIKGEAIALVPTMGYLHEGHLELIKSAKRDGYWVVVSIFVNPLQFGPKEDFGSYPRDLERDMSLAFAAGASEVFAPAVEEMYPSACLSGVEVSQLGDWLCGQSRPGHFRGVCTVVSKLFNIIQPDRAYFGEKDAQQLAIIRQMVSDLNFPIEIVGIPIVREEDGLAKSSRNVYLNTEERKQATVLYKSLLMAKEKFLQGERDREVLQKAILAVLGTSSLAKVDYVEICDPRTLQPVSRLGSQALIALAVKFGNTRLIDNITVAEA